MSFTRRKSPIQAAYRIDNVVLERLSSICDLNITLDESLSFCRHINSVISRANGKLGFIRCCASEFYYPHALRFFYVTFVRSHLSLIFIFKLLQHEIDCDELYEGLTFSFNTNPRDLRNPKKFRLQTRRTNYGQQNSISIV
jgi:hypothetical protein